MSYKYNYNKRCDYIRQKQRIKRELVDENIDKIVMVDIIRTSSLINLNSRYIQAISNININAAKNLGLINIKKYGKHMSQILNELKKLFGDKIAALTTFMTHLHQMHNNIVITKNMKIRQDINPKQVSSHFI